MGSAGGEAEEGEEGKAGGQGACDHFNFVKTLEQWSLTEL